MLCLEALADSEHVVDTLYKLARAGQSKQHACRNLHKLMDTAGVMLPIKPDCMQIRVKRKKTKSDRNNLVSDLADGGLDAMPPTRLPSSPPSWT